MRLRGAALAAVMLLALVGCGESDAARAKTAAAVKADREYAECVKATKPLADALGIVNSRVSVGLNIQDYSTVVGDAKVKADAVQAQVDTLPKACVTKVGVPLATAMGNHIGVLQVWNSCVQTSFCTMSAGQAQEISQKNWKQAVRQVKRAQVGLESLKG